MSQTQREMIEGLHILWILSRMFQYFFSKESISDGIMFMKRSFFFFVKCKFLDECWLIFGSVPILAKVITECKNANTPTKNTDPTNTKWQKIP